MVQTGMMGLGNAYRSAYAQSFGAYENGTPYAGANATDLRAELKSAYLKGMGYEPEMKALLSTAGGVGTAGNALVPVYVDPMIVDRTRKFTPWTEIISRVTNMGLTADYNVITAKGAAVAAAEDAALADVTDTEDRVSQSIKYLYAIGRVTGQIQAAAPPYMLAGMVANGSGLGGTSFTSPSAPNAKQYEVLKRSRSLKELEENLFWNGNSTTSGVSGNANGTEYDGIISLQSTTNKTDLNTAAMSWANVETSVKDAYDDGGRPSVAGCSSSVYTDLRAILIDAFRLRPADMGGGQVSAGIASRLTLETMAGPIQVVPSQYLSNTSGSKAIYFLDTDVIENRVLQDMSYQELAQTNDSEKFMLKEYLCLINRAPAFNSFIGEIA